VSDVLPENGKNVTLNGFPRSPGAQFKLNGAYSIYACLRIKIIGFLVLVITCKFKKIADLVRQVRHFIIRMFRDDGLPS